MKVRLFVTFGGNVIAGDAEDDDAPMLKLEFCNELADISDEEKFAAGRAALKALGFEAEINVLSTLDAKIWAGEFCRMHGGDPELMLAWFANAVMVGFDEGKKRQAAECVAAEAKDLDA